MDCMSFGYKLLAELYINKFNTKNIIDMSSLSEQCSSIENLYISDFNTSKVNKMNKTFYKCSNLIHINFGNINAF